MPVIRYTLPKNWLQYDLREVAGPLVDAKALVEALRTVPHRREWVESLQLMELKREVAGTSRIEGAEFTERELDEALSQSTDQLVTRAQRQARAAKLTYQWIASLPDDRPIDRDIVIEIHRRIVTGADDDHCNPGELRTTDENVTFGFPRHRGVDGGALCKRAFDLFVNALRSTLRDHDPLIQALAAHYHLAAMHPFLDGNGRAARALEALFLRRAGLRDTCFIAMSNYYYDEKTNYLRALSETRQLDHDLTPFLVFGLKGIQQQTRRLLGEIQTNVKKELFRNVMHDLFGRLQSQRRRVISTRQIQVLRHLLNHSDVALDQLIKETARFYASLKTPTKAAIRDLNELIHLGAILVERDADDISIRINLDWPTQITETEFFKLIRNLPRAKTHLFLG